MKKNNLSTLLLACCVLLCSNLMAQRAKQVNPFIGTAEHGHTYPGAVAPFGMVQLSPDTRLDGWDGCSGYHYSDSVVYGFSHTHLSGTGCLDYGDILFIPVDQNATFDNYASGFKHQNEKAWAGYYCVKLDRYDITAELTATERAGYHRYTFNKQGATKMLLIDLKHRDYCISSSYQQIDKYTLTGSRNSKAWNPNQKLFFATKFSLPIKEIKEQNIDGRIKLIITFEDQAQNDNTLEASVAISSVSEQGALINLDAESAQNFASAQKESEYLWNRELGKIDIVGGTKEQQTVFYTALYHSMIAPNIYSDANGAYCGMDGKIYNTKGYARYSVFSLWDTFRTLHPLLTIIDRKRSFDFVNSALDMYKQSGVLPVWELWGYETYCMIGMHGISMLTDCYRKGIYGDNELTLQAMINNASYWRRKQNMLSHNTTNFPSFGLEFFDSCKYISSEWENESVSKNIEYSYNMWCVAQIAHDMGQEELYNEFIKKAQYYKNLYNPKNKFMQPKENCRFTPNFNPTQIDINYTEGNGFQYTFFVPQDISGLKNLMGGDSVFVQYLDSCFFGKQTISGRSQADVTGLIGQYAHGNEPSHHTAYLYCYAGVAPKTQKIVNQILTTLYSDKPSGICGNDDCGQMSAWYVMSAMGFYPVCPGSNEYVIGSPLFDKVVIHFDNGNNFTLIAPHSSPKAFYIKSSTLNGKRYDKTFINHFDIITGGTLAFEMSEKPNYDYGKDENDRPLSEITDNIINPEPYLEYEGSETFTDSLKVTIHNDQKTKDTILYSTCSLQVGNAMAHFYKLNKDRKVTLLSQYDNQYTAGGPQALIDQRRGNDNWRLGAWQGYQGIDFECILDLGEGECVKRLGANFIQDISPWIFMPLWVKYYVSEDGEHFNLLEEVSNPISEHEEKTTTHTFFTTKSINARYIKVVAKNRGVNPAWHLSPGEKSWLFIDEIVIE